MGQWNPLRKKEQPTDTPTPTNRIRKLAEDYLNGLPYVLPVRTFWNDLRAEREFWPLLLPVLAWIAWRTYHEERARIG